MAGLLKLYLIATGIIALIAMAAPSLVILGFYLLIIPGLILSFAPTAFFWGCIFALIWWLLGQAMGDGLAAALAFPATAALLWLVPTPWQAEGRAVLARSILEDVTPAERFAPTGHIRVESGWPRWDNNNRERPGGIRAYSCDNLCLALLFEPGVESVTVGSAASLTFDQIRDGVVVPNRSDRTFRLVPKAQCPASPIIPDLDGRSGLLGDSIEANEAINAEWALKLANDVCLVGEPARVGYDMLFRSGEWRDTARGAPVRSRWSLGGANAHADYTEVRTASAVIARNWNVRVTSLARPFSIAFQGSTSSGSFGWSRSTMSSGRAYSSTPDILELLKAHSSIRRSADQSALVANLRSNLAAALANPAIPAGDPVWTGIPALFNALAEGGANAGDRALVLALVGDLRIRNYDNFYKLQPLFASASAALRAAIVARLLAEPLGGDPRSKTLGTSLAALPPGVFSTLTDAERALLADPDRRRRATGLIRRLADQGADAVPMLLDMMEFHGRQRLVERDRRVRGPESDHGHAAHRNVFNAARAALCRIGPEASGALPALERMAALDYVGHDGRDWDRLLVRLGKPVNQIAKPANMSGNDASYRRNLRHFLDRFDPERHCD